MLRPSPNHGTQRLPNDDDDEYRPPNANQEVSNTNHFGSVSDSLGRFAATSESMASICTQIPSLLNE